jgi:RNA polymerase-binding transcription factor DksA
MEPESLPQMADVMVDATADDDVVPSPSASVVDVDAIAADLADVEVALARLDAGTYWTDEVTGEPLPDELLATSPTARRLPAG